MFLASRGTGKGKLFALRIKNISRRRGTLGDGEL